MPLYAIQEDNLIHAREAVKGNLYHCPECFKPLKLRKGKRFPHFYHPSASPSCRLYSKSEDHLLLQLQIQKILPPYETAIEKPMGKIYRIADVLWEKKKIVFEIQCSLILEGEVKARIEEYGSAGYAVIWILDDRIFNKKILRPSERFLRERTAYFARVGRTTPSLFYDQFEILQGKRRIKRGKSLPVDWTRPQNIENTKNWPTDLPKQLESRKTNSKWCFWGDLLSRTLSGRFRESLSLWKIFEEKAAETQKNRGWWKFFFENWVQQPYLELLNALLKKV